jgi:prepilin peptidase CpaA
MMLVATACLLAVATAAAASDVRTRRVSNRLNAGILVLGLGWRVAAEGLGGLGVGVLGVAAGLGLLLLPFAARWLGAGDVKLLAALGAWLGPVDVAWACLFGVAAGGALAATMAVAAGRNVRREVATNLALSVRTLTSPVAPGRAQRWTVPMAVPLAAAAAAVFVVNGGF